MRIGYAGLMMCMILNINTQMEAQEATYKILYDVRSIKLGVVSHNGEWIGDGKQGVAFYYNTITESSKNLSDYENNGMAVKAISNSGMLLGSFGKGANAPAAYYKNNKWTFLPIPKERNLGSQATTISENEEIIGGWIDGTRSSETEAILPCIWKLTNGKYEFKILPYPKKDINGNISQGACVRDMSADGSVIVGDYRNYDGWINLPIIWKRGENGEYTYKIWGEELVYNLETEKPGIYPEYNDYVTAEQGTPEYEAQFNAWKKLLDEYMNKRKIFYNGIGKFELRNIAISRNGHWMAIAWKGRDSDKGLQAYRLDIQNEEATIYNGDYNTCPRAVLDDGTMLAFSGFNNYIQTGHVYKNKEQGQIPLYEWIKEEKGIDISEDFLFTIPIKDPETGAYTSEADSIVTGCCTISKDGSTVLSFLADPDDPSRIINYYVRKETTNNLSAHLADDISMYVHKNILYIKGTAKELTLLDLTGKNIYHSNIVGNTLSLSFLQRGIYLARLLTSSGETITSKIYIE